MTTITHYRGVLLQSTCTKNLKNIVKSFIFQWIKIGLLLYYPLVVHSQTCQYLAYDGFNYTNNSPLEGQFGGVGWAYPWNVQENNTTIPGYQGANIDLLTYGSLLTFGNYVSGGNNSFSAGRGFNLSDTGPFSSYINSSGKIGESGTTLFMSVMLRKNTNDNEVVTAMLQGWSDVPWVTTQNPRAAVGYFSTPSNVSSIPYWGMEINGTVYNSSIPVTVGNTAFLVMSIEFGVVSHTVRLWVNPVTIGSNSPAPDLIETINGVLEFNSLAMYLGGLANQGALDEVRLANSFECVAPDNMTVINIPPDASFTTTPSIGISPLNISFDASSSIDADGTLTNSYIWNYMDGSPIDTTNTPITSHIYTNLGEFNPTLTITDDGGLQHTAYGDITVTNSEGSFPCLTTLRSLEKATCGQSNGSFLVNPPSGAVYTLTNDLEDIIPISATLNTYDNLAIGSYTLIVNNPLNNCVDTLFIQIDIDSTTCPDWEPPACLKFGMNLDYFNYFSRERPFKDLFKGASTWLTFEITNPMNYWDTYMYTEMPIDASGYPTQVPFSSSMGPQGARVIISANRYITNGNYTLWYDGQGIIQMGGGASLVTNTQAGRIDFTVENDSLNMWFDIMSSTLGDHVRNIRILRENEDTTYLTQPFYQPFLDKIQNFHVIRFNEWGNTNTGTFLPINWEDRAHFDYFTQATNRGVSYEYMVQLCNTVQRDAWVHIPHTASEQYIEDMAVFFRDNLNANLKVYVEFSNEVWNWQFAQSHYVRDNSPQNIPFPRRYAEHSTKSLRIWTEVYSNQSDRLKRVLNVQVGNPQFTETVLSHMKPEDYDYVAPSWYFGYSGATCAQNFDANTTSQDIINCTREAFEDFFPYWRIEYWNASLYGKQIIHYEGGQHMSDNGASTPYTQALQDAQIHPDIYNLYNQVIDSLKQLGPVFANAYNLGRTRQTLYGAFGHVDDIDIVPTMNNAPKWMALMDNNCTPLDSIAYIESLQLETEDVLIFPNPSTGIFNCVLSEEYSVSSVEIISIIGQKIDSFPVTNNQKNIEINLNKEGIYLVRFCDKNNRTIIKKVQVVK